MAQCVPTAAAAERQRKKRGASDVEHWRVMTGTAAAAEQVCQPALAAADTAVAVAGAPAPGNGVGKLTDGCVEGSVLKPSKKKRKVNKPKWKGGDKQGD